MKILITSGPTREPIDGVRFITNLSSGKTGRDLADYFKEQNHEVVFLYGKGSAKPRASGIRTLEFETFQDLNGLLQTTLRAEAFDVVIHLAAVGDYSVQSVRSGVDFYSDGVKSKIDSRQEVTVTLRRNFKILERIKSYSSGYTPRVIGFKLTHTSDKEVWRAAVEKVYGNTIPPKLRGDGPVDLVVHNDVSDIQGDSQHRFRIVRQNHLTVECDTSLALGQSLETMLLGGHL